VTAQQIVSGGEEPVVLDEPGETYVLDGNVNVSSEEPAVMITASNVTFDGNGYDVRNDVGPGMVVAPTTNTVVATIGQLTVVGTSLINFGVGSFFYCVSAEQTPASPVLPGAFGEGHGVVNYGSARTEAGL
jgi:hypothetical protein